MKTYSTLITESTIVVPTFNHPDLVKPRDPNGRFWKTLEAANEVSDKASRGTYEKASKLAKDLYALLITMNNDPLIERAKDSVADVSKLIEQAGKDTLEEMSSADVRMLKNYLFIIYKIDSALKHKSWFKSSHVDVKAGYVPFRGAAKDTKIKYRMVFTLESPVSVASAKELSKTIVSLSPMHTDYVAGVEWNKDRTAFAVLLSNSQGYKR